MAESVTWEARAVGPGPSTPIAKGVKTYLPAKDIVVREGPKKSDAPSWVKWLVLDESFAIGASVHREQPLSGFGLMVFRREDQNGFSWEWFGKAAGSTFTKLQGSGRVTVQVKKVGESEELTSVEFLEDVTLRYLDDMSKPPGTVTHEVLVKKGSILAFAP
jgi:hypothetical protein